MSRQGNVYVNADLAGYIEQNDQGFIFQYDADYLQKTHAKAVSLTLPLQSEAYTSHVIFPFFDGLIPEGWLLDIAVKNWKLNPHDRMALLLTCCQDCLGNVSIVAKSNGESND